MATVKFLIESIDYSFGRMDEIHVYFQIQKDLLDKGHTLEYYHISTNEVATTIETIDHFYNFIRSFKFLPVDDILEKLSSH
jgi:hypothetical protein